MKLTYFMFMLLMGLTLLACDSEEEDEREDPLIGAWESGCGRMFTDAQISVECGTPTDQDCEDKYALYYYNITATFVSSGDADADLPQQTYAITSYYNTSADNASDCRQEDRVAAFTTVKSYVPFPPENTTAEEVNTDNGFPEDAKGVDLFSLSYARTYYDDDVIDTLNDLEVCELSDWTADTSMTISGAENCSGSLFSLTDRFTENTTNLTNATFDADGNWDSDFVVGTPEYSIYVIDNSVSPRTLALGRPDIDSDGDYTDTELESAAGRDGASPPRRHKLVDSALIYQED